ncbi:MAG: tetratricopeptide repeat protein [Anaerolineae bacterium]|nr:tetratricopeptide repeat protein [Anaerolineae bacterium]
MFTRPRLALLASVFLVVVVATAVDGRHLLGLVRQTIAKPNDLAALIRQASTQDQSTDRQVAALQRRLQTRPDDQRSLSTLGSAYLQKARETGDPSYYGRAEQALQRALALQPDDVDTLNALGVLALARHQFREGKVLGEQAWALNSYRAFTLGVLGDAEVELGEYDAAVQTFQQMVDLRPDLSSYARVSYIRELYGDVPGALDAMRRAVNAGGPATENVAWTQTQLALLYFNAGNLPAAEIELRTVLALHTGYVPALAGLGRVYAARGQWDDASLLLRQAVDVMPMPEYVILLGDVYTAAGRPDEAATQYALVRAIQQLHRANGVELDMESALFDADHDHDLPDALVRARAAYAQRPSIHAADVLAWTLYKAGQPAEAQPFMQIALRLGTRDALLYYHAGMIALANGDRAEAQRRLAAALDINPYFSLLYSAQAHATLEQLRTVTTAEGGKGS